MHIFGKKKEEHTPELSLVQVQEKQGYDFFAALAKALLLFMLVYGALGGFLSAFEIEYNKGLCMLVLFLLSLVLSAAYETGKRWLTNLLSLSLFGIYLFIAISNYWIINSGYYSIMNTIFAAARKYLAVSGGVEYSTVVQDEYATVTLFVMFLGMVGVILLNIQMQNKCSLLKVVLITFSPYVVPFYLECTPSLIYILLLFIGYVVVAILQNGDVREHLSGQMRYVLPVVAVVVLLIVRGAAFILPQEQYIRMIPGSDTKKATMEAVGKFAQYGMSVLFQRGGSGPGMSGGVLSHGSAAMPTYETDLLVRYTPYSYEPVYLKAFTGKEYTGTRWLEAEEDGWDDGRMETSVKKRKEAYEVNSDKQGRGLLEVKYVGADKQYEYRPYYTDYDAVEQNGPAFFYTYYPAGGVFEMDEEINATYVSVPFVCVDAVAEVCEEAGFSGSSEEIALQIVEYFDQNYSYTLRPGFVYGNPDFISHFLLNSKKGYCAHFASSATMLFRYMGIPARYVEGYAFSYANVVEDGFLVEDAQYKDYYDGYSPIGETALIELEVPDACAHAWVEIYVEDKGWVVVDPTPASTEQETASFWDVFRNMEGETQVPDIGEADFGEYLETALGGVSYLLLAALFVVGLILLVGSLIRIKRERSMTEKERICLEYSRLFKCLVHKDNRYQKLRTLAEQLECMRREYELKISGEQEKALYEAFFGATCPDDAQMLRKEIVTFRRVLYFKRKKY